MIRLTGWGRGRRGEVDDQTTTPDPDVEAAVDAALDGVLDAEETDADLAPAAGPRGGLDVPDLDEQLRMVEAMLFAADQPLSVTELAERMPVGCDAAHAVRELEGRYATRGVQLVRVAGKWAFRTAPDLAFLMRGQVTEQRKLSKAAVETLAVIAYHQPVTRAEIEEIRQVGVSKGTVDLLMELDWVKLGRRRQTPGRPVTFVTTDHFLQKFGLDSLRDLPGLDELRQAGLLDRKPPSGVGPIEHVVGEDAEASEDEAILEVDAETEAEAERRRQEELMM